MSIGWTLTSLQHSRGASEMAYIDPEGMCGGDRMAMLSDSAKMAWPWFWCASNTVGRVELNYRDFVKTAFRQFKKPPTEQQFWEWVAEFHESYLMFVYEINGQAWGQWWVSEKYLPTYKAVSDKRTPAPTVRDMMDWQEQYAALKISLISGKCRILNVSKILTKVLPPTDDPKEFPLGEERSGKIEERSDEENLSPASAGAGDTPSQESLLPNEGKKRPQKHWYEEQHDRWYPGFWHRTGKLDSRKAHEKAINRIVDREGCAYNAAAAFLVAQVALDRERFEHTEAWNWRVKMNPATWLNGERWNDETPLAVAVGGKTKQQQQADEWSNA